MLMWNYGTIHCVTSILVCWEKNVFTSEMNKCQDQWRIQNHKWCVLNLLCTRSWIRISLLFLFPIVCDGRFIVSVQYCLLQVICWLIFSVIMNFFQMNTNGRLNAEGSEDQYRFFNDSYRFCTLFPPLRNSQPWISEETFFAVQLLYTGLATLQSNKGRENCWQLDFV